MTFMEKMTELVVGRNCMQQREYQRLEKQFAGAEEKLKEVKTVTFGGVEVQRSIQSAHPRLQCLPKIAPRVGSLRRFRLPIERSQSDLLGEAKPAILPTPSGPPDLTAVDLTADQLKRTYSEDKMWDPEKHALPPLLPLVGIGAYRHAPDAPARWQQDHLEKRLAGMHGFIGETLHAPVLGLSEEVVTKYRKDSRSLSFASSKSSHSETSDKLLHESTDSSGTRIIQGFIPSTPSSVSSSDFKKYHFRTNSSRSMTSTRSNSPQIRESPLRGIEPPPGLTVISEGKRIRKIERPCAFGNSGDGDAVWVSDDEKEDKEEDWEPYNSINSLPDSGLLSQAFSKVESGSPKWAQVVQVEDVSVCAKPTIDRSKTIKATGRQVIRRGSTRGTKAAPTTKTNAVHAPLTRRPTARRANSRQTEAETALAKTLSGEPDLYMKDCKGHVASPEATDQGNEATVAYSKQESEEGSYPSSDESTLIMPTIPTRGQRRSRSDTTVRAPSTTTPIKTA